MAESQPAEALLGDNHAVIYKISCLKSIGGLSPSGIQNKLVVGKRRDRKSSVCCLLTRKDLRARKINTTGELELRGGFMNYCSDSSSLKEERESKCLIFLSQGFYFFLLANIKHVGRHFIDA